MPPWCVTRRAILFSFHTRSLTCSYVCHCARQDGGFLRANGISAVLSLGTGNVAAQPVTVCCVDLLDLEDELLLPLLRECVAFIDAALDSTGAVLVHCAYGQSRSAAVCVAYLMATHRMPLQAAYDAVQHARPCVNINVGFLRQLALFERMGADCDVLGATSAHTEVRQLALDRRA